MASERPRFFIIMAVFIHILVSVIRSLLQLGASMAVAVISVFSVAALVVLLTLAATGVLGASSLGGLFFWKRRNRDK